MFGSHLPTSAPFWPGTGRLWLLSPPGSPPPQLLPQFHVAGGRRLLGLPLVVLGAWVAGASLMHWRSNDRAIRNGEPLPRSPMPFILTIGIVVVGLIAAILAAVG